MSFSERVVGCLLLVGVGGDISVGIIGVLRLVAVISFRTSLA